MLKGGFCPYCNDKEGSLHECIFFFSVCDYSWRDVYFLKFRAKLGGQVKTHLCNLRKSNGGFSTYFDTRLPQFKGYLILTGDVLSLTEQEFWTRLIAGFCLILTLDLLSLKGQEFSTHCRIMSIEHPRSILINTFAHPSLFKSSKLKEYETYFLLQLVSEFSFL